MSKKGKQTDFESERVEEVDFSAMTPEQLIAALQASAKQQKEMADSRKALANEVIDVKGNIRVFCRVRPFLPREREEDGSEPPSLVKHYTDDSLTIYNPQTKKDKGYNYDAVLQPATTQEEAFKETRSVIEQVLEGFNVSVFAYGQTGSGKTWTMIGNPENRGMNYRCMSTLFERAEERSGTTEDSFQMSMFEIYNEQLRDLLTKKDTKLDIKATSQGMTVAGLTTRDVTTMEEMVETEDFGFNNRSTGKTNMNEHSSRSHCLTLIQVTSRNKITGVTTWGKLYLIDLAGSERVNRSGVTDEALKEAQHINKSLSALTTCILALHKKDAHIPFRDSKLTHILQDSLGGNAKTMMFVNISPSGRGEDANETESSLRFASRVRKIELGQAKRQVDNSDMVKYKKMYEDAQEELGTKDAEADRLRDQVRALQEEQQILQETLGQSDGELTMLRLELEEKTTEMSSSATKITSLTDELNETKKKSEDTEAELDELMNAFTEAEEDHKTQVQELSGEMEGFKVKLEVLSREKDSASSESAEIMAQREADLAQAQLHAKQMENECSEYKEKAKVAEARVKELSSASEDSATNAASLEANLGTLTEERSQLASDKAALEEAKAKLEEELELTKMNMAQAVAQARAAGASAPSGAAPAAGDVPAPAATSPAAVGTPGADPLVNLWDGAANLAEGEKVHGNKMLQLLESYTTCAEAQIDAQQKLISMLNDDEEDDEEAEEAREEEMAMLETEMFEKEDEKVAARNAAIQYAQSINMMLKQAEEEKANLQRQYKFQFSRTKAAFDVVKDKLMKNIGDRAAALKAVRQELEAKEAQLRRVSRQKQDAERGLLEMRGIFEDMKRIEHMKRGIELLKYPMGGGKPALKYLQLSNDENELQWRDNKKASKFSSLPIREVEDVVIGWETQVFSNQNQAELPKPWFCLSVVCKNRTLDLSVSAEEDVITWVRGLLALVCIRPGRQAPPVDQLRGRINFLKAGYKK